MTTIKNNFNTIEYYNDDDYLIWSEWTSIDNIPKARDTFWDRQIQFNQNKIDPEWCVYHAGTWCIADEKVFNYVWFLQECSKEKHKYWYKPWVWMYIYKWVDMIRHIWNKNNPKDKIITFRIKFWSKEFETLLDKWYSLHIWYRGNRDYNKDKNDDWILEKTNFWKSTYWHSIRITKKDWKYHIIVDNYNYIKHNTYKIPSNNLIKLVKNWVFFWSAYIYVFENDFNNNNNKMTEQLKKDIEAVEFAYKNWITNNKKELNDIKKGIYTPDNKATIKIVRMYYLINNK